MKVFNIQNVIQIGNYVNVLLYVNVMNIQIKRNFTACGCIQT